MVLSRQVPRFKPFDVQAAFQFAMDHYGDDIKWIAPSLLMAAWNAHHKTLIWRLSQPSRRHPLDDLAFVRSYPGDYRDQWWGQTQENQYPMMYINHGEATAPLTTKWHDNNTHVSLQIHYGEGLYASLMVYALKQAGGRCYAHLEEYDGRGFVEVDVSFEHMASCAQRLEDMLNGDLLIRLDETNQRFELGPVSHQWIEDSAFTTVERLTAFFNHTTPTRVESDFPLEDDLPF